MPSDRSKLQATNASNGKSGTHNFGKSRGDSKTLTVENLDAQANKNLQSAGFTPKPAIRKKCFRCGSVLHLIYNCPEKGRPNGTTGETRAKVANVTTAEAQVSRCQLTSEHVTTASVGPGPDLTGDKAAACVARTQQVNESLQQTEPEPHVDPILADGWSQLHYIDVHIKGLTEPLSTLYDSGAQLCCVDASVIEPLNLLMLGHVMLTGLNADLVREVK